jgi:hypothetical protein
MRNQFAALSVDDLQFLFKPERNDGLMGGGLSGMLPCHRSRRGAMAGIHVPRGPGMIIAPNTHVETALLPILGGFLL